VETEAWRHQEVRNDDAGLRQQVEPRDVSRQGKARVGVIAI